MIGLHVAYIKSSFPPNAFVYCPTLHLACRDWLDSHSTISASVHHTTYFAPFLWDRLLVEAPARGCMYQT